MKEYPVTCFCGSPAHLHNNKKLYGKEYGKVPYAYICDRFPVCRGSVGVHPQGKPLGTIPDPQTKAMRIKLHAIIDPLWRDQTQRSKKKARGSVYGWLRRISGLSAEECHVGMFDADMCLKMMMLIRENPYEERTNS
jgi:hypothetical protein